MYRFEESAHQKKDPKMFRLISTRWRYIWKRRESGKRRLIFEHTGCSSDKERELSETVDCFYLDHFLRKHDSHWKTQFNTSLNKPRLLFKYVGMPLVSWILIHSNYVRNDRARTLLYGCYEYFFIYLPTREEFFYFTFYSVPEKKRDSLWNWVFLCHARDSLRHFSKIFAIYFVAFLSHWALFYRNTFLSFHFPFLFFSFFVNQQKESYVLGLFSNCIFGYMYTSNSDRQSCTFSLKRNV